MENKLSKKEVIEIRNKLKSKKHTQLAIAKQYNVSEGTISNIKYNRGVYSTPDYMPDELKEMIGYFVECFYRSNSNTNDRIKSRELAAKTISEWFDERLK